MFEKDAMDILMKFLDRKVLEAEKEVTARGTLSEDKAIPLMLKMQFNHIRHLEESVNDRFGQINQRFEEVGQRFEEVGKRFEEVGKRFDKVDERFDKVNERFDKVNERFERIINEMNGRFAHTHRLLFGSVAFLSLLMTTLRFIH